MTKLLGSVASSNDEQEGNQSAGHVQSVETGGDVEGASVGVAADADTFRHQGGVLIDLASHEDRSEHVANEEPLN